MGLFRVFLLESYKWVGWDWMDGWDLCVGLLYEHRFAVLKMMKIKTKTNLESTFNLVDAYRYLHPEPTASDFTFYRPSVSRSTELTSPKQRGRT